ncbi:hypothetical protein Taro_016274 [Colocasia esculenta]|uniref:NAC domain-containing protein n=1 Tax=Colocasia esculenta TaxID=4460 RepID=A0A843UDE3_COLES|nr:hypothetical protein [Colocasia esculenta]
MTPLLFCQQQKVLYEEEGVEEGVTCRIGSGPQNEWYLFSHKKYPTGTRTNRATNAGFLKATGRDKVIHHSNSKSVGTRKTLVFYTGQAPHGQKTNWIMHVSTVSTKMSARQRYKLTVINLESAWYFSTVRMIITWSFAKQVERSLACSMN